MHRTETVTVPHQFASVEKKGPNPPGQSPLRSASEKKGSFLPKSLAKTEGRKGGSGRTAKKKAFVGREKTSQRKGKDDSFPEKRKSARANQRTGDGQTIRRRFAYKKIGRKRVAFRHRWGWQRGRFPEKEKKMVRWTMRGRPRSAPQRTSGKRKGRHQGEKRGGRSGRLNREQKKKAPRKREYFPEKKFPPECKREPLLAGKKGAFLDKKPRAFFTRGGEVRGHRQRGDGAAKNPRKKKNLLIRPTSKRGRTSFRPKDRIAGTTLPIVAQYRLREKGKPTSRRTLQGQRSELKLRRKGGGGENVFEKKVPAPSCQGPLDLGTGKPKKQNRQVQREGKKRSTFGREKEEKLSGKGRFWRRGDPVPKRIPI